MYPAPNLAASCAANETAKAVRAQMFDQDIEFQMGIEKKILATAPSTWIYNHTADPAMDLAIFYKQIALYWNEPETIGKICKNLLENRMRAVAEFAVSQ